jgi:hypothetical protein
MARSNTNGMGRRAVGRGDKDRQINSGNRPTMGTQVYSQPVDAPSGSEFRAGMLVGSHNAKDVGPDTRKANRKNVQRSPMGARRRITPNVNAVVQADPRTQTTSRVVPPAIGSRSNFWNQSRSYGAPL